MKRAALALALLVVACRHDMIDRPAKRPLGSSEFFPDRSASRPQVFDTVARRQDLGLRTQDLEARGRDRFEIFCAPCHGRDALGDGIIVQHGFPRPPSLMTVRPDDVVDAITNGHGEMYSYADRVPESDRLAIAAYVQSLQAGQKR